MLITDEMFNGIIRQLKNGKMIFQEVKDILPMIKESEEVAQLFFREFLEKIIASGKYKKKIMEVIMDFLYGKIDINNASDKLFNEGKSGYTEYDDLDDRSLIIHDNLKRRLRDYKYSYEKAQFYHFAEESLFVKMIRVLFEFTRSDEAHIRGVCFDFCLFLCALDIIKNGRTDFVICYSAVKDGSHYFICRNKDLREVIDPFYGIYTTRDKYKISHTICSIVPVGESLAKLGEELNACDSRKHYG